MATILKSTAESATFNGIEKPLLSFKLNSFIPLTSTLSRLLHLI